VNALLVCASPVEGASRVVSELAPHFDLVIAVDGGSEVCADAGVVPDIALGDFDSIDAGEPERLVSLGVRVVKLPADKDETDLELALAEARSLGASSVTITAASGGRLDHAFGVVAAMAGSVGLNPELVEPDSRAWLLSAESRDTLTLAGDGATVSLLPFCGPAVVSATGVRWPLDRRELSATTTLGISNVVAGGDPALIVVHTGVVLVVSPRIGDQDPAIAR
jgi:thiamine pyrophosphokinase